MIQARSWVEIDRSRLLANVRAFARVAGRKTKIAPVIKANAYGHGSPLVVQTLQNESIWGFCVASGDEALVLRPRTKHRILVMSSWQPFELPDLIRQKIELVAWDLASARTIDRAAGRQRTRARIHLKLDSGGGRIGMLPGDFSKAYQATATLQYVTVVGSFSWLASSEHDRPFTEQQLKQFSDATQALPRQVERHIACTAAAIRHRDVRFDALRLGIGLYGLWPSLETRRDARRLRPHLVLAPVLSWYTRLLQLKRIPRGSSVGYARTFRAKRRMTLGIMPVGYWDGYDRRLSNNAAVSIRGQRAPVVGRISMNLTMIDCSRIPHARPGDRVTLIGADGAARVTADEIAGRAQTINYEVVTRINPSLPRVLV